MNNLWMLMGAALLAFFLLGQGNTQPAAGFLQAVIPANVDQGEISEQGPAIVDGSHHDWREDHQPDPGWSHHGAGHDHPKVP